MKIDISHDYQFKVYGKECLSIVCKAVDYTGFRNWIYPAAFYRKPDGELAFNDKKSNFNDQYYCDDLRKAVAKSLKYYGFVFASRNLSCFRLKTFKQMRELPRAKERHTIDASSLNWRCKNPEEISLEEIALLGELIEGKKSLAAIAKCYSKEAIDNVISHPADPLTATSISLLEQELENTRKEKNDALKQLDIEMEKRRQKLIQAYDSKIDDLRKKLTV